MPDIRRLPVEARGQLAQLLNLHSPADAAAAYYALDHPAERVERMSSTPETEPHEFWPWHRPASTCFAEWLFPLPRTRSAW
jgi:hypothetical protein